MLKRFIIFLIFVLLFSSVVLADLYIDSFITLQTENEFMFYHYSEKAETVHLEIYKINFNEMLDYLSSGITPKLHVPILRMSWDFAGKKWNSSKVNVENLNYGIYMVVIKTSSGSAISLLSKTKIWGKIVYLKDSAFVKFFDVITGEFLKGVELFSLSKKGDLEIIGKTNMKGEITISRKGNEGKLVFLKTGGVLFHSLEWPKYIDNEYSLSFFTDRPVYKPGDTVNFGGFVRKRISNNEIAIPLGEKIKIEIEDRNGRRLYTKEFKLDDFGAFEGSFRTFKEISRGSYSVNITIGNASFYRVFRIEDYIKPKFKVEISGKEKFDSQKPLKFKINSKYYYGAPVGNVEFGYTIFTWKDYEKIYYDSGKAKLSSKGTAEISFKIKNVTSPTRFSIAVNISDESGAEVQEEKEFMVYPSNFYLKPTYKDSIRLDEKFHLYYTLKDIDDRPISRRLLILVNTPSKRTIKFLVESDKNGNGSFSFLPSEKGLYKFEVQDVDDKTTLFKGHFFVYEAYYQTMLSEPFEIRILSEKILPGEGVRLEVLSSFANLKGKLILIADNWIKLLDINVKNGKARVVIPLPDKLLSNEITVFAFAAKAGRKLEACKDLQLAKEAKTFELKVETDSNIYSPGSKVELRIKCEETSAQFFVAVVDKAALDTFNAEDFWKNEVERIYNYYSMRVFRDFRIYSWQIRDFFTLTSEEQSREVLAQIKSSGVALRSNFSDTAAWFPMVRTDDSGTAVLKFRLPDNLTTWEILVVGLNKEGKYALIKKEITTTKEIVLTPILPEYFVTGDEIKIGAMVSNNTSKDQNFKLSCEGKNLFFSTKLFVPKESRNVVKFDYEVPEVKKSKVNIRILAKSFEETNKSDGVLLTKEVKPLVFSREWKASGIISDNTIKKLPLPEEKFIGTLSVSSDILGILTNSIEALVDYPYGCVEQTMSKFLPTLIYKKLLRKEGNGDRFQSLPSKEIDSMIDESLRRLYGFQHSDGGWGWWKNDETSTFMTAYVLHGFSIAISEGYEINADVLKNGLEALKDLLVVEDKDEYFYYMLYVLSLYDKDTIRQIPLKNIEKSYEEILYLLTKLESGIERAQTLEAIIKKFKNGNNHIELKNVPYFLDELQLNALLLMELLNFRENSRKITEICDLLTNYLISKKMGRTWKNTKQTAFCVLALSNLRDLEFSSIHVKISMNNQEKFAGYVKGNLKIPIEGENSQISLEASGNLYWDVSGRVLIPYEDYVPITSKLAIKRSIQKRIFAKLDGQDVSIFVPVTNKLVIQNIETVQSSNTFISSYNLKKGNSNAFVLSDHSLIFNNEYTGLELFGGLISIENDELLVKGSLYRDSVQLTNVGIYKLRFVENQPLKVGDILRSEIEIFGSGDYVIVEDSVPSVAIPMKYYREKVGRKFFSEQQSYAQKEIRKDITLTFFRAVGDHTVVHNYYRIMFAGRSTVLPAKVWEMYETNNFASSEFDKLEVEF